ncbi:MAG TPA: hypothetical protein VH414_16110 [Lichenihabitans sp.]|jgi:hypothetical protein|nr:hypothetical protein [Lichenihabitans sp.]
MVVKTGALCAGAAVFLLLLHRLGVPVTGVAFAISIAIDPEI